MAGDRRMNSAGGQRARQLDNERRPYTRPEMPKILVIEDSTSIVDALEYGLTAEGFKVVTAANGERSLALFGRERPDLVLLDLMLPDLPGTEVCKRIRAISSVPIIMLTAKDTEIDKVVGLELGADDYVTKPFSMRELVARVRAVLRRGRERETVDVTSAVEANGIRIDSERHEVLVRGKHIELPPKEFALLKLLVHNAGRVLTRDVLIERVWGPDYVGDTKTLDVHIKRLRSRIEPDPKEPVLIMTIRGVGYKLAD
jgi:two-component system, OmpR family, response regulator RegX3